MKWATPVLFRFNYDTMPSLKSLNIAVLQSFFAADTLLYAVTLTFDLDDTYWCYWGSIREPQKPYYSREIFFNFLHRTLVVDRRSRDLPLYKIWKNRTIRWCYWWFSTLSPSNLGEQFCVGYNSGVRGPNCAKFGGDIGTSKARARLTIRGPNTNV